VDTKAWFIVHLVMVKLTLKRSSANYLNMILKVGLMECCIKNQEDGAEGAEFIKNNIIKVTDKAFDDFAR
jgi:hypothetical protein